LFFSEKIPKLRLRASAPLLSSFSILSFVFVFLPVVVDGDAVFKPSGAIKLRQPPGRKSEKRTKTRERAGWRERVSPLSSAESDLTSKPGYTREIGLPRV
jgi:hypothetical protein